MGDTSFLRPGGFADSHGICAIEFKAGVRAVTFKVEAQANAGGWGSVLQLPIIMAARRPASDFPVRASREFHGWTKVMDQSTVMAKECFGRLNACTAREVFRDSFRPFLGSRSGRAPNCQEVRQRSARLQLVRGVLRRPKPLINERLPLRTRIIFRNQHLRRPVTVPKRGYESQSKGYCHPCREKRSCGTPLTQLPRNFKAQSGFTADPRPPQLEESRRWQP